MITWKRCIQLVSVILFISMMPLHSLGIEWRSPSDNEISFFEISASPIDFGYMQKRDFFRQSMPWHDWQDREKEIVADVEEIHEEYLSIPLNTTFTIRPKEGYFVAVYYYAWPKIRDSWPPMYDASVSDLEIPYFYNAQIGKFVYDRASTETVITEETTFTLPQYYQGLDEPVYCMKIVARGINTDRNSPTQYLHFHIKIDEEAPVAGSYLDVKKYHYFYEPVKWAVEKGMLPEDATELHANEDAPRSEVVEYIWKAKGSPEPKGENPFTDVSQSDDFYPAAVWAYENGITTGTTSTTFDPEGTCTRAQIVTFLCRLNSNQETIAPTTKFSDVNESDYFSQAVSWAVEKEITTGMTPTTFSPDTHCTRAQILTFLWRGREDKDEVMI